MPPTRCTPTTSSESSKPNLYFRPTARQQTAPAIRPSSDRAERGDERTGRGDRDQAGDRAGGGAERGRVPVADLLHDQPAEQRGRGGDLGVDERERGQVVGGQRRAGVEAEPAEPQQAGAEQHERQVVRPHRVLAASRCACRAPGQRQAGGTGVDVHRGAAGEVLDAQLASQPAPLPSRRRSRTPSARPGSRRASTQSATKIDQAMNFARSAIGAGDQRRGDDREHQLEHRRRRAPGSGTPPPSTVGRCRCSVRPGPTSSRSPHEAVARVAEGEREAVQHPQDADDADA